MFPGTRALSETQRNVVANFVPKFNGYRITTTYPLINAARKVAFLVNDSEKAHIIEGVLKHDPAYPASCVQPATGALLWFIGT